MAATDTVLDRSEQHRYEIDRDGESVGVLEYRLRTGAIALMHTEVPAEYGGQGLASRLIRHALDDARRRDLAVLPYCPFVRTYIEKHSEYLDLVPADRREEFEL